MKKLLIILILFLGCEKDNELEYTYTAIHVVETDTGLPVDNATVYFWFNSIFGGTILFNGITDTNGKVEVPSEHYNDPTSKMNVIKSGYWPYLVEKTTVASLTPEGWLELQILKVGNYPDGSKLLLNLKNPSGTRFDQTGWNTSTDSIIFVKAYGGQLNRIDWRVVDVNIRLLNNGTLNDLQIPKFDTLRNVTLNY